MIDKRLLKLAQIPLSISGDINESLSRLIEEKKVFIDDEAILKQLASSLISGHHVVLYGPVGTGKTELVRQIAEIFNVELESTTVGDDWDSPDYLIGWEQLSAGKISFVEGKLLIALRKAYDWIEKELLSPSTLKNTKQACWLLLDEINRGNINRYLSSLITALEPLSGSLGERDFIEKYKITVRTESRTIDIPIPKRFRIIGTMNTFDKNLLYRFPSALKGRRFVFIPINPPSNLDREISLIEEVLLQEFQDLGDKVQNLLQELRSIMEALRKNAEFLIGTAVFIDLMRIALNEYRIHPRTSNIELLDSAFSTKIVPMLLDVKQEIRRKIKDFLYEKEFKVSEKAMESLLTDNFLID